MTARTESNSGGLPLVTVLIGCYNQARFVVENLESVRQQTYPRIQLIIWDDCSRDNSVEVIHSWIRRHNFACTFLQHDINRGVCKSVNEAMALARGQYICFVAADDIFMPDRIARQVQILENSPSDVGVVYSDAFQIDENGRALPQMFIEAHRKMALPPEGFLFDVLFEGNFIPAMTTLVRRECFKQVGAYDEDLCYEDWDMWMRISRTFRFVYDKIPAAKYRIVSNSLSRTTSEEMLRSADLLRVKYFSRGWLNAEQGRIAAPALYGAACRLHELGSPIPLRWKGSLLKQSCSAKAIALVVFSTCGISFLRFQQVRAFWKRLKSKFFRPQRVHPHG
ncbi:MAG TPA: glycosyltransferase [Candidatus Acidoferrum sp.]|nr:glycosyltransferase [Candidatus Acidoferrum sp.]